MQTTPFSPPGIDSLTGFRFVAAMMVFFSHYAVPGLHGPAFQVTQSGYAGVTFFFVLSGFIITYNYLESFENGSASLRGYFVARFARVYPLYLFFTLYMWFLEPHYADLWLYLLALQPWHPELKVVFGLDGPSWSIGVEFFLYLCFPLLVPLLSRLGVFSERKRLLAAAALTVLVMLGAVLWFVASGLSALPPPDPMSSHHWLYRLPATRLGDFLLGMFGAVYFMRFAAADAASVRRWGIVTTIAALAVIAMMATKSNYFSAFSWDVGYAMPGVLFIIGLAINGRTRIARALAAPAVVLLGEASYALYLAHFPAIRLRSPITNELLPDLVAYVLFIVLVIALSIGLHMVIEKPARSAIRRLFSVRRVRSTVDARP